MFTLNRRLTAAPVILLLFWATLPARGQSGAAGGEWRTYGGDLASTRYAPAGPNQRRQLDKSYRDRLAVPARTASVRASRTTCR